MTEGKIGPHNGKELDLMLSGDKPLAFFSVEPGMKAEHVGDADFAPHVESGRIRFFSKSTEYRVGSHLNARLIEIEWRAYCLPAHEWRAKIILALHSEAPGERVSIRDQLSPEDMARMNGTLLGYSADDIEAFVGRMTRAHDRPTGTVR